MRAVKALSYESLLKERTTLAGFWGSLGGPVEAILYSEMDRSYERYSLEKCSGLMCC